MDNVIRWDADRAGVVFHVRAKRFLMDQGLPKSAILFEADREPADVFTTDAGKNIVRVGSFEDDFSFFVDVDSGQVVFGMDRDPEPTPANSSLIAFAACLRWVDDEFPFYSLEDDSSVKIAMGRRALEFLRSTDPDCVNSADGFWASFVHDVEIGDYYAGSL